MKKISICIACYNESGNIKPISEAITALFSNELKKYDYELLFIDNASSDSTIDELREISSKNKKIKVILNAKNFGAYNSPYYGLLQTTGDCSILMACDFQDPVELLPKFVEEWEKGYKIVVGVKNKSKENPIIYAIRSFYYYLVKHFSNVDIISHYTSFGLYDKSFINLLASLDDSTPFLRGIVAEFGYDIQKVYFEQPKRKVGKSHHSLSQLYSAAMLSFTTYTTLGLRIVTLFGFIVALFSFIIGATYLIYKITHWYTFSAGMAPVLIGIFFLGSIILVSLGFVGEYVISINKRLMNRPLVIEKERINFNDK